MTRTKPPAERFWPKVDTTGDCWIWTASINPKGYGQFRVGAKPDGRAIVVHAHRFAYIDTVGPIPEGLELDHLCRVRACVNPMHLEPVTTAENQRRSPISFVATLGNRTHCTNGHEWNAENTYWYVGSKHSPHRQCRQCKRDRRARARAQAGLQNRPREVRSLGAVLRYAPCRVSGRYPCWQGPSPRQATCVDSGTTPRERGAATTKATASGRHNSPGEP
jgi:hypothetical protein